MKQRKKGYVVSVLAPRTIKVRVERSIIHPIYKKRRVFQTLFLADAQTLPPVGSLVEIESIRRISKRKSWKLSTVIPTEVKGKTK